MAKKRRSPSRRKSSQSTEKKQPSGDEPSSDAGQSQEDWSSLHIWQIQAVRDLLVVAAGVGIVAIGYALRTVTVPLLIALLLAYLFEPLIARLSEHEKITRARAVGGLIVTIGAFLGLLLAIVIPLALTQTADLVDDINSGKYRENVARIAQLLPEDAADAFDRIVEYIPGLAPDEADEPPSQGAQAESTMTAPASEESTDEKAPSDQEEGSPTDDSDPLTGDDRSATDVLSMTVAELEALIDERLRAAQQVGQGDGSTSSSIVGFVQKGAAAVWQVLGRIISAGLIAFLIPFYFFFFSLWYPDVLRFARELLPKANRRELLELIGKMDRVVAGFVRGRIVISLIMGVLLSIGWAIMGVPYPIVTGMIVGIFCAVPYLGGVGIPIAVGLLLLDQFGMSASERMPFWLILVGPTAVFAIVQLIEGYVLTPMIAGKATNLDPVTIVVAVLAGGSVLGIYGMLLAIPIAACGKIVATEVFMPRVRAWLKGEIKDPLPIQRR